MYTTVGIPGLYVHHGEYTRAVINVRTGVTRAVINVRTGVTRAWWEEYPGMVEYPGYTTGCT